MTSSSTTVSNDTPNQFKARYAGGYKLYSNSAATIGVQLVAGTSGWTSLCDKNMKENFKEIDGEKILKSISRIPITEWSYKTADPNIRYIGPMAQDFAREFRLSGKDSKGINSIDIDGVNMAGIQALEKRTQVLKQQNEELTQTVEELKKEMAQLKESLKSVAPSQSGTTQTVTLPAAQKGAALYGNEPNPFTESTVIRYFLPESVAMAELVITDAHTNMPVTRFSLTSRGEGKIEVHKGDLKAGTYVYTLLVDGRSVEAKKMIIAK